ncbi:hypothetical protein BPOR_1485g00020 [Botrytis porri]|uniref:Uncharacterized protein n=1 Tax=Botrytis porri TaxID=87229 RepID=A0A4Z1KBP8_9HELO|nr:hypothetical protein BPOR_1485g00020 [Botrytis porri]
METLWTEYKDEESGEEALILELARSVLLSYFTFTKAQEERGLEPQKPIPKSNSTREHRKDTQC